MSQHVHVDTYTQLYIYILSFVAQVRIPYVETLGKSPYAGSHAGSQGSAAQVSFSNSLRLGKKPLCLEAYLGNK